MSILSENVKTLIWKIKGPLPKEDYAEYIEYIARECKMPEEHFRAVLRGEAVLANTELGVLLSFFREEDKYLGDKKLDDDKLQITKFLETNMVEELTKREKEELLERNLQYLLKTLTRGNNVKFIKEIGVNPSTVSRWKQGLTKPDKYSQANICRYFGYHDTAVLRNSYILFGLEPVSCEQKKQRIKEMIESMDKDTFESIYPALEKLLK